MTEVLVLVHWWVVCEKVSCDIFWSFVTQFSEGRKSAVLNM